MATRIFLSYACGDDERFVRRLYEDLTAKGFEVWFDRVSMPSRQLTFYQEIRDAIAASDRLILVVGPKAVSSDYVTQEWRFAYVEAAKCVNPIVRLGDADGAGRPIDGYDLIPEDLRLIHAEDFRRDEEYPIHLENLARQLSEPMPPTGKLVAVPELPPHYLEHRNRVQQLRDILLVDLRKPVVVSGAVGRVGLHGMGGIGKSVLACALAHHPEVRRAFPDGIFWVSLAQQPKLDDLQRQLAKQLGGDTNFSDAESGKEKLRELLKERATLLVLDNVWTREAAEAFNVMGARGRLLLTTRDAGLVTALAAHENHYQVQFLSEDEARALLAAASGVTVDALPDVAADVVNECGRLPLALALCGGMLRSGTSWGDLRDALRDHDLTFLSDRHAAEEQHASIWKAIDVSVRALHEDERERLAELAVFSLDAAVPEAAVETLWRHTADMEPRNARRLLADLAQRSLVQMNRAGVGAAEGTITLHDLVYDFVLGVALKQCGTMAALHGRLIEAYRKKCAAGWPSGPNDGYFFQHLANHLVESGKRDELVSLLFDFRWLQTKCGAGMTYELLDDYQVALDAAGPTSEGTMPLAEEQIESLRLVRDAIALSTHVIAGDPNQLAGQLLGRLQDEKSVLVAQLMQTAKGWRAAPWLRPITASLTAPGGPLVRTLTGHSDVVSAVAVTPDGKLAISASWDSTLKVWELASGREVRTLTGHTDSVNAAAVTPDGKLAISASSDHTLKVWELASGRDVRTLKGHHNGVSAAAVTPDGKLAISASLDGTLKVWELASGRDVRTLEGHTYSVTAVAVTPDGKLAISASSDETLKVWELASGREVRTLEGHLRAVWAVAVTPDGKLAISASYDNTLKVWDLASGREVRTLKGHHNGVSAVAVTPDGKLVISASHDNTLKVWELASGREVRSLKGHTDSVIAVALTQDGKLAISASSDKTLKVWDLAGGREVRIMAGHLSSVRAVAVTPDGKRAISVSWDYMKVWKLASGREVQTLNDLRGRHAVALTADGQLAILAGGVALTVWESASGREVRTLVGHADSVESVAVTPDGKLAISASSDGTLKVWELASGREVRTLKGHTGRVAAVAVTPNGKRVVSASWDRTLKIWELASGQEVRTLQGQTGAVNAVAVTPDSKLAISASDDKTLKVWDLASGQEVRTLQGHTGAVNAVVVTPDRKLAISASGDRTLKVWELETGREVATFCAEALMNACAAARDGLIAAGDDSGRMHFLRLEGYDLRQHRHDQDPDSAAVASTSNLTDQDGAPNYHSEGFKGGLKEGSYRATRMADDDLKRAHRHSSLHREELLSSTVCGCFYCLSIFPPAEILDWTDGSPVGLTALCPKCGIDSVIGSESGYDISIGFLTRMHQAWFERHHPL